jgi:hypothetical protein
MRALNFSGATWSTLRRHMAGEREQVAFLLARHEGSDLTVIDTRCLTGPQVAGTTDHVSLADAVRGELITWASMATGCLIEAHSHPHGDPAAFSAHDLHEFTAWVPHVRWRLRGAAYIALVHAPTSFDALVWSGPESEPRPLEYVSVDQQRLRPTGITHRHLQRSTR